MQGDWHRWTTSACSGAWSTSPWTTRLGPPRRRLVFALESGFGALWQGIACVDGSASCPRCLRLTRCGRSVVAVTGDVRMLGGAYGSVLGGCQEIGFAELYAVIRVLREKAWALAERE